MPSLLRICLKNPVLGIYVVHLFYLILFLCWLAYWSQSDSTEKQLAWLYWAGPLYSSMTPTDKNAMSRLSPRRWWILLALLFMSIRHVLLHANVLPQAVTIKITYSQEHEDHREWNTTPPPHTDNSHYRRWLRCHQCLVCQCRFLSFVQWC